MGLNDGILDFEGVMILDFLIIDYICALLDILSLTQLVWTINNICRGLGLKLQPPQNTTPKKKDISLKFEPSL